MATDYNPIADNVERRAQASVDSSTNATPIVITTSAPHGFQTGDRVEILEHETNTHANGVWTITVIDDDEFELDGSAGTASGLGGIAKNLNLDPAYSIPSDNDPAAAASVNVGLEATGDRSAWLAERVGSYRVESIIHDGANDSGGGSWAVWSSGTAADGSWTENADLLIQDIDCQDGDAVEIEFSSTVDTVGVDDKLALKLMYQLVDYGGTPAFGSATEVTGSGVQFAVGMRAPVVLRGRVDVSLTRGKFMHVWLAGRGAVVPTTYDLRGDWQWTVRVLRSNS